MGQDQKGLLPVLLVKIHEDAAAACLVLTWSLKEPEAKQGLQQTGLKVPKCCLRNGYLCHQLLQC